MRIFLKFELKLLLRNPFIGILTILIFALLLFATQNGIKRVEKQQQTIKKLKDGENLFYQKSKLLLDSLEKGTKKPFSDRNWYLSPDNAITLSAFRGAGSYVILPPAPLSVVSTGQSDIFPYYSKVALGTKNEAKDNENFENPFNTAIGDFDLAFVLVFIFPLFIISLTYNVLSSEKEQGTLNLLLSMPLNIRSWLVQKIAFRYVFLMLLMSILLMTSLLVFGINMAESAFLSLLIATSLYTLFWFLCAFSVNLLGKSSSNNATILLGIWLFFTLMIPSVANMLAGGLYPVPSRVAFVTAQRDLKAQADKDKEKVLAAFYAKNPQFENKKDEDEKSWKDYWREGFAEEDYLKEMMAKLEHKFQGQAQAQRDFAGVFQWLSPAILFQNKLNQLAKTDTQSYLDFDVKVAGFEANWTNYFKNKFMKDEKMTTKDFDNFPRYK